MKHTTWRGIARGSAALTVSGALVVGGASVALADPGHGPRGPMSGQSQTRQAGPLAALVAAGTITSAEATAVSTALRAAHDAGRTQMQADHAAEHAAILDALVAKGTLTRAQADAITAGQRGGMRTLIANGTITQAQADAIRSAMTATRDQARADRDAQRRSETSAALAKLVASGTLSQAQADAVSAALAERPTGGDRGGMGHGHR